MCCSPWGWKESDTTVQLNLTGAEYWFCFKITISLSSSAELKPLTNGRCYYLMKHPSEKIRRPPKAR